jgi:uncharacterized caspase-like protein
MRLLNRIAACLALLALLAVLAPVLVVPSSAQAPERRFAFVIGNSEYPAGRLPTAANDAGLLAETLRGAGFDVTGARDLDQDTLRRSIRDFLQKVSAAGPEAVTFVYLGGYGLQFEGENYLVPIDATISRDEDIPIEAFRISDFTRPLAGLPGTAKIVVIDAARQHPFTPSGLPLASGLALVEPDPSTLVAFNATPGSIAPVENGPYGAFAESLSEMIATGGLGLDDLFARVRLRVNEKTGGVAMPWYASKITRPFLFMQRAPGAPPPPQAVAAADLQSRSISDFQGDQEAFAAAMARDTLTGYDEFLAAYPDSPLAVRVRAIVAVRREAITWRRTLNYNTREAYWSYLRRYPQGAHVADAQRRLARLAAAFDPPPAFVPLAYDVPPPPPDEVIYLSQPVVVFDGPGFYPPPPIPLLFLPPPPPAFIVLEPPPPPIGPFFLPAPVLPFAAIGVGVGVGVGIGVGLFAVAPAFVVPPPPPPIQQININNTTIVNNTTINNTTVNKTQAAALPASLVTKVNSGALQAPPTGGQTLTKAALTTTGTGSLGYKQTPQQLGPPKQLTATQPGTPATNLNANATPTPGTPPGPTTLGTPRPPGAAVATPTPGTPPGPTAPGTPRPPGAAVATPTPGTPPGPTTPGTPRPPGAAVATPTPGTPPGPTPPGTPRPPGAAVATPTPRPATPGGTPPNAQRPSGGPPAAAPPPPQAPQLVNRPPPPSPPAARPTPPPPPVVSKPPLPPPVASRPPPPPPVASRPPPPPPVASRPPPPPPVASRPPPPPPVVSRPPPPPPVVSRPPPPPPVASRPPPPPPPVASRPPPPAAAAKKCTVENGKQVCR